MGVDNQYIDGARFTFNTLYSKTVFIMTRKQLSYFELNVKKNPHMGFVFLSSLLDVLRKLFESL